uniref:non-specific serine/threonine protein kinase n=1 Tax=Chlamydomonas euryale TaxID=1486919 RepID=A0A7R9VYE8_9CHLO|mmetsp:Transcript_7090/g.21643  ORF Transcript_7090/g.21643 Transcript_7090/m.21643 type:complete len:286 (+) Transcript_7090:163-1020(+)
MERGDAAAGPGPGSSSNGRLEDYQINHLIGRGQYSTVYAAQHVASGTAVALKKVAIFDMMDPKARQDCLKEVKILENLQHPNIVKCFTSFIQDNELIIVMEWAESGDLAQALKQRAASGQPFTDQEVWQLFGAVCSAVQHMHARRILHRDLKPSNIFITADGRLKLGDLGLSRYFSSRTLQAVTTVGTPYYMSPEVIKGQPYDFSSDIWSLGCLLYELVALRNPFFKEGQSLYVLGKNINACSYEPLAGPGHESMQQLVSAMIQPSPSERPSINALLDMVHQVGM